MRLWVMMDKDVRAIEQNDALKLYFFSNFLWINFNNDVGRCVCLHAQSYFIINKRALLSIKGRKLLKQTRLALASLPRLCSAWRNTLNGALAASSLCACVLRMPALMSKSIKKK